ncbi:serine hydrolase domain-containing protein [Bacillus solimangrovi]|uniref:Penicillin-binding protein n=1 Tax=Bacillus solimangrovi TaxID=1305675 RepID=A0A1E5LGR8_9BACI|nr:serine hydrolase [Bacillus solimangrovi]OEH93278.1 penicillin-binding protein [Bacillus solimangrovi]
MKLTYKIEEVINNYSEEKSFSGSILVQNEEVTYKNGLGYANLSEKLPVTSCTRFGMASGSKIFTSIAICQLVERGLLSFNTYLRDCLDINFPNFHSEITIHHLLTHTSGIPDYFDEEIMEDFEELWRNVPMYSIQSPHDFLPMFQNGEMKFEPGSKFSYSNSGFIILGLIVEQITGMKFPEYIRKHIFDVCDMSDSGYFRMDQLPERTALGYIDQDNEGACKTNIYSVPIIGGPDGGAFTTVLDLTKFWDGLLNRKILNDELTNKLLHPHVQDGQDIYHGYGVWILKRDDDIIKYFIFGFDPGVRLHSSFNTKTKTQTHILSNIEQSLYPIVTGIDKLFS